jgi:hypothetical protein
MGPPNGVPGVARYRDEAPRTETARGASACAATAGQEPVWGAEVQAAAPTATGTSTRLPYSVHEPS